MKTKDVKEYYTKYMYYYNNYNGYSHDKTNPWEELNPSNQSKWIIAYEADEGIILNQWMINGPEPVKTRKVINARV